MQEELKEELKVYEELLCSHLIDMTYKLQRIPEDKLDFTFAPPAPTPRILATHCYQWLVCDRQHILEADAAKHARVPDLPADREGLCSALKEETENWRQLIRSLTPEKMMEKRLQFNNPQYEMTVRGFVGHIIQNSIYKNGQLSTIYFALGLDGTAPYDAPFPNPIYEEECWPRPDAS